MNDLSKWSLCISIWGQAKYPFILISQQKEINALASFKLWIPVRLNYPGHGRQGQQSQVEFLKTEEQLSSRSVFLFVGLWWGEDGLRAGATWNIKPCHSSSAQLSALSCSGSLSGVEVAAGMAQVWKKGSSAHSASLLRDTHSTSRLMEITASVLSMQHFLIWGLKVKLGLTKYSEGKRRASLEYGQKRTFFNCWKKHTEHGAVQNLQWKREAKWILQDCWKVSHWG